MKVLLSFVGEQDPYSDKTGEEGSIVTLCRHLKPEVIYLYPSAKGFGVKSETQSRAQDTEIWINSEINKEAQVFVIPLQVVDPTDYSSILPLVRRVVEKTLRDFQQVECEIHLNCSSGTPQLKSTWLILANAGLFKNCRLWQVANPLFKSEKRVSLIEITFLEEENLLSRIKHYAEEFLFQRMSEECLRLKDISVYSGRKEKAGLLSRIFRAYQNWDLIRYDDAYKRLYSVLNEVRATIDLNDLSNVLEAQVQMLAKLKGNTTEENEYNLVDLYMNARRRLIRSDFTDTLSRFWRIYEGILFAHLRNVYYIEPTDLAKSGDKSRVKAITGGGYFYPGINKLSIVTSETVLAGIFKDKVFRKIGDKYIPVKRGQSTQKMKLSELLKELRERRNESIVAHGMKPVAEDDAVNCLEAIESVMEELIPAAVSLIENYSLKEKQMELVISVLDQAFAY